MSVWEACVTLKLRVTFGAAAKLTLPVCEAWMVQVPALSSVTVDPLTVHTDVVSEAKLTDRPEDAVALTLNGAVPSALLPSAAKVMI